MTIKTMILNGEVMVGPKTGKSSIYNGMQIPINNSVPMVTIMSKRRLNIRKVQPRESPSKPVVKGKMINSLGWISNNKKIVNI